MAETKTYREALREAMVHEMERDENVILMGEDIGVYGGTHLITDGLIDEYGPKRVMDTPLPQADDRCADGGADDPRLRQRRVHDAIGAELLDEAIGHLEGAAVDADVLAHQQDALVVAHLRAQPVGDRP